MRPTIRQLQYIIAVADLGQISAAAKQLHVSQPSLSAQLSEVEAELGSALFYRRRAGAMPTPLGEEVIRRARRILHDLQDLRAVAQGASSFKGRLRLGVLPSIGPYLLPSVVRRLHQDHPEFRLVMREESTRDLEEGLRSGRLDMIISTPEDHPGVARYDLFEESLWLVCASDHPLSRYEGETPVSALRGQTLLTLGPRHRLSHIVASLAHEVGAYLSDEYEGTSLDAIRIMAASGSGVAIVPQIYAATESRRGSEVHLSRLKQPTAKRNVALLALHDHVSELEMAWLATVLSNEASRLMSL
ncbi:MAG: LysR family transcriptional regulator [Gammaproteobacteria bacterium]|nr:LysR family transcriptional regulator [Gammaproteobacteria bacterium]